jgi:hypothetical protein
LLAILTNQQSQGPFSVYRLQHADDNPLAMKTDPVAPPLPLLPRTTGKSLSLLPSMRYRTDTPDRRGPRPQRA